MEKKEEKKKKALEEEMLDEVNGGHGHSLPPDEEIYNYGKERIKEKERLSRRECLTK